MTPHSASSQSPLRVAVIGGGPAGLMAAEVIASAGAAVKVQVFDTMPSVGRKFLLAGKGGLNLTHSEPFALFVQRYGAGQADLQPLMTAFDADAARAWALGLGVETFVGSSGRVFPVSMKSAPLLRAWLHRLRASGVAFSMRHRWLGWVESGELVFERAADGTAEPSTVQADAVVLALGGASWARLGSDGAWQGLLAARGVAVSPLVAANCGFDVAGWTPHFTERFAGQPFKSVALQFTDSQGRSFSRRGEFVATQTGVEGSLIYAASSLLRDEIAAHGSATFLLDLLPDKSFEQVRAEVAHPRGSRSLSSHLKSRLSLDGIKAGVLHELAKAAMGDAEQLSRSIKALPITLVAARPIDEAISSAGGVDFSGLDAGLGLKSLSGPGAPVFCAGEMLNWEAPTGGYLLGACMATGRAAGHGVLKHLGLRPNEILPVQL